MNRQHVINKMETIASRVASPIHVPFKSKYEGFPLDTFFTITEIYLFGSALYKKNPRDIDLLAIHHSSEAQNVFWRELCKEFWNQSHSYYFERKWTFDYFLKRQLKGRMRNIDMHFEKSLEEPHLKPKNYVLAWSRGRPNVRNNLQRFWSKQKGRVLPEELSHLREELKESTASYESIKRIVNALSRLESFEKEKDTVARELASYSFYKGEIPELEDFLKKQKELAIFRLSENILYLLDRMIFYLKLKDNVGRIMDYKRCSECGGRPIRKIVKIRENGYELECGHIYTERH